MAATAQGRALTQQHRAVQTAVMAATVDDTLAMWSLLDPNDVDAGRDAWLAGMVPVVDQHYKQSATAGVSYYRSYSSAELGQLRDLSRIGAPLNADELTAALALHGPIRFKHLVSRGYDGARAFSISAVAVVGVATQYALDGGRLEIVGQAMRDGQALGFQRVASGGACAFCLMLTSNGPVYKSRGTAGFQAHDNCKCQPEPVFSRAGAWTEQATAARQIWDETGDLNSFRRAIERPEMHGLDAQSALFAALAG